MYDYANARIRGLRSKLLRPPELEALATRVDLTDLVAALARTDYGFDLEAARRQASGLALVEEAVRGNLCRRLRGLRDFFTPEPGVQADEGRRLVGILLTRHDLDNLVAVLRGKVAGATATQIELGLLPAGELEAEQLAELSQAPDLSAYLACVRRWRLPYAGPFLAALATHGSDRRLPPVELALRQGFLEWALAQLGRGRNAALVRAALTLETDAANLLSVLRLIHRGAHRASGELASWLLPGGRLSTGELAALLEQPTAREAVAALAHAPWNRVLTAALPESLALDDSVALEWAVQRFLSRWAQAQYYSDPLGIGLALAYQAAKVEEARSLRLIARGIAARWPRERLRDLLAGAIVR